MTYRNPAALLWSAFRIDIDGVMLTDLGWDERSHSFPDSSSGAAFELLPHVLDALGEILSTSRRLVPANIGKEQLTGEVQGDRLIELTFNGDRTIEYFSHYLVWRDGVPIGRSLNGADNYVDITVLPGTTYQYFITADYLADGSLEIPCCWGCPMNRVSPATLAPSLCISVRTRVNGSGNPV